MRPLLDDASGSAAAITRDYALETLHDGAAPLLSVWGGKITTFRKLSEDAADLVAGMLNRPQLAWTRTALLPGGDLAAWCGSQPGRPDQDIELFVQAVQRRLPWLPAGLARRRAHAQGSRISLLLGDAHSLTDLGEHFGGDLYRAELDFMWREEWARSANDMLWRRSKLGLQLDAVQRAAVAAWCDARAE